MLVSPARLGKPHDRLASEEKVSIRCQLLVGTGTQGYLVDRGILRVDPANSIQRVQTRGASVAGTIIETHAKVWCEKAREQLAKQGVHRFRARPLRAVPERQLHIYTNFLNPSFA